MTIAPPADVSIAEQIAAATALSDRLSRAYLDANRILPLRRDDDAVVVASAHHVVDPEVVDELRLLFDSDVRFVPAPEEELRQAIGRVYGGKGQTAEDVIAGIENETNGVGVVGDVPLDDLVHLANEAPVVKLVNLLVLEALNARASDVHLEAYHRQCRVRYRIDGVLQPAPSPPAEWAAAVVSRLKIMADLDVAERRVPQDGRITLRLQARQVDVRVSTLPTLHGESVVLRLLDKEAGWGRLEDLGMSDDTRRQLELAIARPNGIVLATGPTGSGKTTTLYAAVDKIRTGREKILTVEDPVEYEIAGVPQVPVNEKVGVTFATALRALLRQDPDVLLVGEIRDQETAEIATHAALTGHLVLSTLHTNDAATAVTRLLDLGVAPYLVASTVEAVLAQRLVRRCCDACKHAAAGGGCDACLGTGFRGRTGLYELLILDEELRAAVVRRCPASEIRALAIAKGMQTLQEDGLRLVAAGTTTMEEVRRVAHE